MTDLSPAAQAVMIAAANGNTNVVNDPVYRQCISAALRAASEQLLYKEQLGWTGYGYYTYFQNQIGAIADELKNHQ